MSEEKRRAPRPPRQRPEGGFKLKSFPKEFEKDLLANIDRTFSSILILSLVIFLPTIYILSQNAVELFGLTQEEMQERKAAIIKKLYVQIEEEEEPEEVPEEEPEEEEQTEAEAQEERKQEFQQRKAQPKTGPSLADIRAARSKARAQIAARRAAEEAAVASSGALALLTGGEGAASESSADLLGDASSSDVNLDKALSGVNKLAIGSNGTGEPGTGRGTKGGRVDGGSVDGLVGGIGGASSKSLGTRRGGIQLADVAVRGGRGEKSRSSAEINKVIKKSTAAIEQCFKREQRLNPSLRGVITVSFKITKRGTVRDVKIVQDTVGSSRVASCVKRVFSRLRGFGRAKGDVTVPNAKFTFN